MKVKGKVNCDALMIPVQLSDFFSEKEYIITTGIGNCFFIIRRKAWAELADILYGLSDGATTRKMQRLLLGRAIEVTTEKKLLMLPNYYISWLGGGEADVQMYYDEEVSKNVILVQKSSNSDREAEEYERNIRMIQSLQQ